MKRRHLLAASPWLCAPGFTLAQRGYPDHAIKAIVTNAPGSSVDTIGRVVCAEMARLLTRA